jgi:hypothetical protein
MNQQITITQHYVPEFYMKNFGQISNQGKKAKAFVSFYQFKDKLFRKNIDISTICYGKYFYDTDNTIENFLANKEKRWSAAINVLLNSDSYILNEEE